MKRTSLALAVLLAATTLGAAETPADNKLDAQTEKLVRPSLTICNDLKVTRGDLQMKLPAGMTGTLVRVESARGPCQGQYVVVTTSTGGAYVGLPWFLGDAQGATLEEKLKNFTWTNLQETFTPVVDRTRTPYGLYKVTMWETTERGKVPTEGEVDPDGRIFFMGHFRPAGTDMAAERMKIFAPFVGQSPARGAASPAVTVVEFSDFECPSCKHASTFLDPILEKYGDRVRYVRYDTPLVGTHPWAMSAAIAGRAVYRQKPELFWEYKKQVYSSQAELTAFTFDDFARGFAQDHDLDMKKYDEDIASQSLRDEMLKGVGTAFSNEVRATPTYLVNGLFVDPGEDGKALETYVAGLLKK